MSSPDRRGWPLRRARQLYLKLPLKRQLFSILRPLPIPRWLYQHLHFQGAFTLDLDGRSITVMHHGHEVENELFWRGLAGWEHCRLNGFDVACECKAVSSIDGPVILYELPLDHAMSASLEARLPRPGLTAVPTTVEGVKLATYIRQRGLQGIDLMKIDVEMHEESVLRGMEEYLGDCLPPMVIEILTDGVARGVESLTKGMGYQRFYLENEHGPVRVEELRGHHWLNTNFLLCTSRTLDRAGGLAGLMAAASR